MKLFTIMTYVFAAIALITGANDWFQGLESQRALGANLPDEVFSNPIADNVFRFFSGLWLGTGILFILFIRDLERYKPAMIALLSIVIIGGIGRLISLTQYGMPDHPSAMGLVIAGLLAELVISPIMVWWLYARYKKS